MPASESTILDVTKYDGKASVKAKEVNSMDFASSTIALAINRSHADGGNIALAKMAESAEVTMLTAAKSWPRGMVRIVVKAVFDKFQPIDMLGMVEAHQQLGDSLRPDPAELFRSIANIQAQCTKTPFPDACTAGGNCSCECSDYFSCPLPRSHGTDVATAQPPRQSVVKS